MDRSGVRFARLRFLVALGFTLVGTPWVARGQEDARPRWLSVGPAIFADGFESEECELWSSSSNPLGAPDVDLDLFGNEDLPTVYCALPAGYVADTTDCDDLEPEVHPGAPELCNGVDDDCDPTTPDGEDDPTVGQDCDGPDGDLCEEGTWECLPGGLACSDDTPTNIEICNNMDDDCDGTVDEDIFPDTNPLCIQATVLGGVVGDDASPPLSAVSFDEQFYRVTIGETIVVPSADLTAQIDLQSPPGSNFDLYVTCASCGDPRVQSSTNGTGMLDTVLVGRDDEPGDSSYEIVVEVRWISTTLCGFWNLTVNGNVATANRSCN